MQVTIYKCPQCYVSLPYDKAFLENGHMVAACPRCRKHIIIERNVTCSLCPNPAEHLTLHYQNTTTSGNALYRPVLRCQLHVDCDDIQNDDNNGSIKISPVFKCPNCHKVTKYSKALLSVVDGTLHAICPQCSNECILQRNVTCKYYNCSKPATNCKPAKSMAAGYEFRCDEHKDMKVSGCFIATAACGSDMAGEVVLLKRYRDSVLRKSNSGRRFIKLYESFSPPIARVIASSEGLKRIIRIAVIKPAASIARRGLKKHI